MRRNSKILNFFFDLTQQSDNALHNKVGLKDSSKKLENMFLNQKSEKNKE